MTPTQQAQRAAVVAEALTWLGTPYHHHARIKGQGVDCAMLLAEVYQAAGLVPHVVAGPQDYPHDWHLHNTRELFDEWVTRYADPLPEAVAPQPGDVGLWRYGKARSHAGIVVACPTGGAPQVAHAYIGAQVYLCAADEAPLAGHRVTWYALRGLQ